MNRLLLQHREILRNWEHFKIDLRNDGKRVFSAFLPVAVAGVSLAARPAPLFVFVFVLVCIYIHISDNVRTLVCTYTLYVHTRTLTKHTCTYSWHICINTSYTTGCVIIVISHLNLESIGHFLVNVVEETYIPRNESGREKETEKERERRNMHACMSMCVCMRVCVCVCACVCKCMYVCVYVHIIHVLHTHTLTHAHMYSRYSLRSLLYKVRTKTRTVDWYEWKMREKSASV